MSEVAALLEVGQGISSFFTLIAVIVFMIIFWEPIAQKIGWKRNEEHEDEHNDQYTALSGKMDTLSSYYNHDTTEILKDIRNTMSEVNGGIRDANTKLDILIRK